MYCRQLPHQTRLLWSWGPCHAAVCLCYEPGWLRTTGRASSSDAQECCRYITCWGRGQKGQPAGRCSGWLSRKHPNMCTGSHLPRGSFNCTVAGHTTTPRHDDGNTHQHTSPLRAASCHCRCCCLRAASHCCLNLPPAVHAVHCLARHPPLESAQLLRPVAAAALLRCLLRDALPGLAEGNRGLDFKSEACASRQLQQGDTEVCHVLTADLALSRSEGACGSDRVA